MSGRVEYIYLTAGVVAYAGGIRKNGHPVDTTKAVVGTGGLVIISSLLGNTPAAPIVKGLGYLLLLGAVYGAVPALHSKVKPVYSSAGNKAAEAAQTGRKKSWTKQSGSSLSSSD